jgi:hypothetical protein
MVTWLLAERSHSRQTRLQVERSFGQMQNSSMTSSVNSEGKRPIQPLEVADTIVFRDDKEIYKPVT